MVQVYKPETIDLGAAIDMLPDGNRIPLLRQGRTSMLKSELGRKELIKIMNKYKDTLKETGPICQGQDYGLTVIDNLSKIYIATKPKT